MVKKALDEGNGKDNSSGIVVDDNSGDSYTIYGDTIGYNNNLYVCFAPDTPPSSGAVITAVYKYTPLSSKYCLKSPGEKLS